MDLKRLFLYFNTVKHLKTKQFAYNFIRRLFHNQKFVEFNEVSCHRLKMMATIPYHNKIDHESVCFLNKRRSFEYISDWACMNEPKLWRYNLHYFDYLLDDGASVQVKNNLIEDWIKHSHDLKEDAWEPYTLSLRIVNWVKYFVSQKNNPIPEAWLISLCQQSQVLFDSIEYHIMANHYLKNGKGLFFSGAYLKVKDSKKWFNKGLEILLEEAKEQILNDGGHYEKSPMYHSILVEDYLDVINLVHSNSLSVNEQDIVFMQDKTNQALDFLNYMLMPDGNIPLFNDSAFNIAPHPDLIFDYAAEVLGYAKEDALLREPVKSLDDSGYYIIRDDNNMCVIDCGSISPDYQPGHTHCDVLSYELVIDSERVIVDTGLHDYEASEERRYSRSTTAHNTIEIDGMEQSEMWGQFRVARRARVLSASLTQKVDDESEFIGAYSPYWSKKYNIVHSRNVKYKHGRWVINDTVSGEGRHIVKNYIHLYPGIDCLKIDEKYFLVKDGNRLARISFSDNVDLSFEDGSYYPEFGIRKENRVIILSNDEMLPVIQNYTIEAL